MSYLRDKSHTLVLNSSQRCSAALDFGRGGHPPELHEPGDRALATHSIFGAAARGDTR
jgi:hypothetical protein